MVEATVVAEGTDTSPAAPSSHAELVLAVRDLTVSYPSATGRSIAVHNLNLELRRAEVLGVVGESGSGKTSTAAAVLGLLKPPAQVESGQVLFHGRDLRKLAPDELRQLRWTSLAFIPQGAMNALNPVVKIGAQFWDVMKAHGTASKAQAHRRVAELLASVELPAQVSNMYQHQLSGGMKQRVCIALAIAMGPSVVVADEPTSALDVVVQKAVIETLKKAQVSTGLSLLLIGHDMALQAQVVDRLAVMCKGRVVEIGPVGAVFGSPAHPYTKLLLAAVPSLKQASWSPRSVPAGLREEAYGLAAAGIPLRPVGADHEAALP